MAQGIREILDAREREVRRSLEDIRKKQIEPLERELAEIVAARNAINSSQHSVPDVAVDDIQDRFKRMKYEDLAIAAFQGAFPNGATIQELLDRIKRDFGRDIAQGSFSPILSRMRQKGILRRNGHAWILAAHG